MTVNGIGVGASTVCGNTTLQLGATRDEVKAACGQPAFINKQQVDPTANPPTKIIEFMYNSNPPQTLVFENGILKDRK